VWSGDAGSLRVRVSVAQTGSTLRGTGELLGPSGAERVEVSGSAAALPAVEFTLGPDLRFVGRLVDGDGPMLRGRLFGSGVPRRALTLTRER
jgi:hypothetical protein